MKNLDNDIDSNIDNDFDSNLDKDLEEIKNKINNISLDDTFKEKLKNTLDKEFENKNSSKAKKFYFPKYVAVACACFVLLTSSVFADQIGCFIDKLFSNTYREIENGIAANEFKEIDMEYIEHDGLSIKIDYALKKDDSLYLVFNVLADEEFDKIYFDVMKDLKISNQYGEEIFDTKFIKIKSNTKFMKDRNQFIFIEVSDIKLINEYTKIINICLKEILLKNGINSKKINGEWSFNINI